MALLVSGLGLWLGRPLQATATPCCLALGLELLSCDKPNGLCLRVASGFLYPNEGELPVVNQR